MTVTRPWHAAHGERTAQVADPARSSAARRRPRLTGPRCQLRASRGHAHLDDPRQHSGLDPGGGGTAGARDQFVVLLPVMERVLIPKHPSVIIRRNVACWTKKAGRPGTRHEVGEPDSCGPGIRRISGQPHIEGHCQVAQPQRIWSTGLFHPVGAMPSRAVQGGINGVGSQRRLLIAACRLGRPARSP